MIPALIVGGVAATYLHKKFPRATEAVAKGIVSGTAWVAKKTAKMVADHYAPPTMEVVKTCCVQSFAEDPAVQVCYVCGGKRT